MVVVMCGVCMGSGWYNGALCHACGGKGTRNG